MATGSPSSQSTPSPLHAAAAYAEVPQPPQRAAVNGASSSSSRQQKLPAHAQLDAVFLLAGGRMEHNILEQILEGSMKPTHLPLETLRKITDEFSVDRIIGEGGFGTVYKGIVGKGNVAVKRIRSSMTINQKLFRREVENQMDVNHENVVRFLGLCSHTVETPMKNPDSDGYIYAEIRERLLCFEYVGNGSLDKYITDELRGLEWDTRYQIIKGICAGLQYLHMEKRILHMDLKPANVLLDDQMVPKITDFGLSRSAETPQTMTTNHFTSLGYAAPENVTGCGTMSFKSDMYSLGAIITELVTGRKGVPENTNNILRRWRHRWNKSAKEMPPEYHHQVTECMEIGSQCLNLDAYARPSISEIVSKLVDMENMKMNPLYWDDDMLGVDPLELQFVYNKHKQILSCSVELSNGTDTFIACKIQTTSPLAYSIEPNNDIMKPRSKYKVDISLSVANPDDLEAARQYSNSKYTGFIVRSIKVNESLTTHDNFEDLFDKHAMGHHVDEIFLEVISEQPTPDNFEDMCDKHTTDHHVDEIYSVVISEEHCSKEVNIDFSMGESNNMDNVSVMPKLLSFQLLEKITNGFSKDMKLGSGSYGDVYKGVHTNGEPVAVQLLHYIPGFDDEQFKKECENLASLQHKNIVQLVGYCNETRQEFLPDNGKMVAAEMTRRAICYEYMRNGSLDQYLFDELNGHSWSTRYGIIKGICQGLRYLHEELVTPLYHLDLKPANILLDENMVPKVADFGISRLFGEEQTQVTTYAIGTLGYMPPEYIDAAIISNKFDIFSLGVIMIKIMTGSAGYFRYAEMSSEQFIEIVHGNWKSMLQTSVDALEPYSEQVKRCIEIALRCVDADRQKRPRIGEIIDKLNETETAIQLLGPSIYKHTATRIEPRSVQLAIINNKRTAPLLEYNQRVMLELTSREYTGGRLGLDLVAVLDVSGSMQGEKMKQLKVAMQFVLWKLSPLDRLSIVAFSDVATKLCPLRQITVASQRDLQGLISSLKLSGDGVPSIKDGLLTGLKVIDDRKVSGGRVGGILIISGSIEMKGDPGEVNVGNVPVYTFSVGEDNYWVLNPIAANSMGGTYSHVKDQDIHSGGLTMALSQCLAGLLTVLVQDLELTVEAVGDEAAILKVAAGSYPQTHGVGGSVTIRFGNLYAREVRKVLVDLRLPAIESERSAEILKVTYSYRSSSSGRQQSIVVPPENLTVQRTGVDVFPGIEEEKPVELQREEARLQTANMIKEAATMGGNFYSKQAYGKLVEAQNMLVEESDPLLMTELQDLLMLLDPERYGLWKGRSYASSSESSHDRQRFAARGVTRLFTTPRMDIYLEQAKKFLDDPAMPLPSSMDDDIKDEEVFPALTNNVASREEEMRRLSLFTED